MRSTAINMFGNLILCSALLASTTLCLLLTASGSWANCTDAQATQLAPSRAPRLEFVLPPMLNFNAFKHKFKKQYASLVEELSRKLNFLPRAMRALASALRYKFGYDTSYKRINEMSDYTQAEQAKLENSSSWMAEEEPDEILASAEEICSRLGSRNCTTDAVGGLRAREHTGQRAQEAGRQVRGGRRKRAASDSGLVWHKIRSISEVGAVGMVSNGRFTRDSQLSAKERAQLPDEIYADYSKSACFAAPRHQRSCGCCYAFSIVSIMEYMICKQENLLTPLSEQYMVDCAKGRYANRTRGCNGAMVSAAGNFVHDFGLESARRYPYVGAEQECPYDLEAEPKQAGYIRMDLAHAVHIHQDYWETVLESGGPLMVHACTYTGMIEYGAGVDQAPNCRPRPSHEMVLVGHGREDGLHYWLIRNSYGLSWGEHGYWRLAKSSARRCMGKYGEAFGTRDGINFHVQARLAKPHAAAASS